MTDEQIKQNAEVYAELLTAGNKEHYRTVYTAAKEGYKTGAHSLDDEIARLKAEIEDDNAVIKGCKREIEELKADKVRIMCERDSLRSESRIEIESLRNKIKQFKDENTTLLNQCEEQRGFIAHLKAELAKAQNPWISVEDNLPDPHTPVYAKNDERTWFFALRTDNRVRPWYDIVGRYPEEVTHWKPIQPLKGGEV